MSKQGKVLEQNGSVEFTALAHFTIAAIFSLAIHFSFDPIDPVNSLGAEEAPVVLHRHAVDGDEGDAVDAEHLDRLRVERGLESGLQPPGDVVVESDVVISGHHSHLCAVGGGEEGPEVLDGAGEFVFRGPLSLVEEVAQEDDQIGLEVGLGCL